MTAPARHLSQLRPVPAPRSASMTTADTVAALLLDLEQAGRSLHTIRAYRSDLQHLIAVHPGDASDVDAPLLRSMFAAMTGVSASTLARRQASVASLTRWLYREGVIESDPMPRLARARQDAPLPRGLDAAQVERLLAAIPRDQLRDRLLFTLLRRRTRDTRRPGQPLTYLLACSFERG